MTSPLQYILGIALLFLVALIYSMTRKRGVAAVIRETFLIYLYIMGTVAGVVIVVILSTRYR